VGSLAAAVWGQHVCAELYEPCGVGTEHCGVGNSWMSVRQQQYTPGPYVDCLMCAEMCSKAGRAGQVDHRLLCMPRPCARQAVDQWAAGGLYIPLMQLGVASVRCAQQALPWCLLVLFLFYLTACVGSAPRDASVVLCITCCAA
jgi:hypothetical protein